MNISEVDKHISEFNQEYNRRREPIKVSFRSLCSQWLWAKRSDVYTHLIHRYPAKILPYIPIFFLSSSEIADEDDYVMDNFSGTGTVLLESIMHPYIKRKALGVEINPLARLIAKVKTTPIDVDVLSNGVIELVERIKTCSSYKKPEFAGCDYWFPRSTQEELAKIIYSVKLTENENLKDFFLVCFSQIIRDVSLADPKIAPPVILKAENFSNNKERQLEIEALVKKKKDARPLSQFISTINKNSTRIRTISSINDNNNPKAEIIWDDARRIKKGHMKSEGKIEKRGSKPLRDGEIGLVITSPPYINAQKYVRTTRLELLWLGLVDEDKIKKLDRQFIGTEKIYADEYRDLSYTGVKQADSILEKVYAKNKQRAAIVSRYFSDMRNVIKETYRVLKAGGKFILVVGNNTVCREKIENHKILSEIAVQEVGFELDSILVDAIRSRGMITKRHETGGLLSDEYILVLSKG